MNYLIRNTEVRATTPQSAAAKGNVPSSLMALFARLKAYRVTDWAFDSKLPEWPKLDRQAETELPAADVVSSELVEGYAPMPTFLVEAGFAQGDTRRHVVAIDIDHRAWLVPSTTPGHSHLYVDVPGGIPHYKYMALLEALADAGVIQRGYSMVSQERGHSDLRLPWIKKPKAEIQ